MLLLERLFCLIFQFYMKTKVAGLIFIIGILFITPSLGQEKLDENLKHQIGLGAWYNNTKHLSVYAAYNLIQKSENEISFSIYNWTFNHGTREIIFGSEYLFSLLKKKSKFDLFILGGFYYNYDWDNSIQSDIRIWHHGPFLGLGIIPEYNITSRFSLSFKINLAYGYQWGTEYDYILNTVRYHNSESGRYFLSYKALNFNYKF